MSKYFNRIIKIAAIFAVTLGVLFGAYFFYTQLFVKEPLSVTLDNSELIAEYQLGNSNKKPVLKIKLNMVKNLNNEFLNLINNTAQLLTKKDLQIQLSSNPNERLLDFYHDINPSLYEALSLNNFSKLQEKLEDKNQQYGLSEINLTISQDFLFLQLHDNNNYLYCILNRDNNSYPQIINNIGSDIQ